VVKKAVLKHFGIKQEVFFMLTLIGITKIVSTKIKYTEIPKYPEIRRDLSFIDR
jgi:phenylalanyl-tRNA synthetase beta chain